MVGPPFCEMQNGGFSFGDIVTAIFKYAPYIAPIALALYTHNFYRNAMDKYYGRFIRFHGGSVAADGVTITASKEIQAKALASTRALIWRQGRRALSKVPEIIGNVFSAKGLRGEWSPFKYLMDIGNFATNKQWYSRFMLGNFGFHGLGAKAADLLIGIAGESITQGISWSMFSLSLHGIGYLAYQLRDLAGISTLSPFFF